MCVILIRKTRAAELEAGVGKALGVAKKVTACQAHWLRRKGGIVERQIRYGCRSMYIRCSRLQECILRWSLILEAPPLPHTGFVGPPHMLNLHPTSLLPQQLR